MQEERDARKQYCYTFRKLNTFSKESNSSFYFRDLEIELLFLHLSKILVGQRMLSEEQTSIHVHCTDQRKVTA